MEDQNLGVVDALYSLRRVLPSTNKVEDLFIFLNKYFVLEQTDETPLAMAQLLALQWLHDNLIKNVVVQVNGVTVNWIKVSYKEVETEDEKGNLIKKNIFSLNITGTKD